MFTEIHPKLPMRDKNATRDYYINQLGFEEFGSEDFDGYLMVQKDHIQLHFFLYKDLDPQHNYGQIYIRTNAVETLFEHFITNNVQVHPGGHLQAKPWGQIEFSLLDPDYNLLTFGQSIG